MNESNVLKQIVMGNKDIIDEDRQMLLAFFSGGSNHGAAQQPHGAALPPAPATCHP